MITRSDADEEVSFTFHHQKIAGFLSHPEAKAPYPAIVLLHGSDRSEARDPYYAEHAENLIHAFKDKFPFVLDADADEKE